MISYLFVVHFWTWCLSFFHAHLMPSAILLRTELFCSPIPSHLLVCLALHFTRISFSLYHVASIGMSADSIWNVFVLFILAVSVANNTLSCMSPNYRT